MKHLLKMVSVSVGTVVFSLLGCLIPTVSAQESSGRIPPPPIKPKNSMQSGEWKFSETFTKYNKHNQASWDFELVDDGSQTTIALGTRRATNGIKERYKSEAILVIDRHENGDLTGFFFEVDRNGQQILLPLKLDLAEGGKNLSITAKDLTTGKVRSTFLGKWVETEAERKPLKKGKWVLRETVSPDQGGYNISWTYDLDEAKGDIYGKGRKTVINGRKAHPNERETVCNIFLQRQEFKPDTLKGTGTEKSPHTKIFYAAYDGWISPSGERFVLFSFENNALAAIIVGEFSE